MTRIASHSQFKARLLRPAKPADSTWAFAVLPKSLSEKLPRRGRTTVDATINGHGFRTTLEPDGQLSHWLRADKDVLDAAGVAIDDLVTIGIEPVATEPEPDVPSDLEKALAAAPEARSVWDATTTLARVDWVHWITCARQAKTREKRIRDACEMLASGKPRVCCFDPSGYYSKVLGAPKAAE